MRELPLRLEPGVDLRSALEKKCRERFPEGAFVVCGIGSLENPRLRLAAEEGQAEFVGPYEMLTLSGTVTTDGAHLRASLASRDGTVVDGHVVAGNKVRTTVELLLVELSGWSLRRVPDSTTGILELQVSGTGRATSAA